MFEHVKEKINPVLLQEMDHFIIAVPIIHINMMVQIIFIFNKMFILTMLTKHAEVDTQNEFLM